jgi:DnaJ-domain-containing protein 1
VVLTMAKQDRAVDNLRVLYLAIEAMRLNEARGIAEVVASAYAQLPPGRSAPALPTDDPYAVIGVDRHDSLEGIERVWKARLWEAHPDHGGTTERTAQLNAAMDAIRKDKAP